MGLVRQGDPVHTGAETYMVALALDDVADRHEKCYGGTFVPETVVLVWKRALHGYWYPHTERMRGSRVEGYIKPHTVDRELPVRRSFRELYTRHGAVIKREILDDIPGLAILVDEIASGLPKRS